jgi:uracil-DNA glycosylase family 4
MAPIALAGPYAGDLLFATLTKFGLANGRYAGRVDDGLELRDAIIINSVKCLPPQNKPTPEEARTCRPFLESAVTALPDARIFIALGRIAHDSAARAMGARPSQLPFGHLAVHELGGGRALIDSYHCSRYNTQTGRLTAEMFESVFARALDMLGQMS